jgi:hypothetical protein
MENNSTNQKSEGPNKNNHYAISKELTTQYVNEWKNGGYIIVPSTQSASKTNLQLDSFLFSIDDFKRFVERVENDPDCSKITGVTCRLGIKPNPITGGLPINVPCLIFEAVIGFTTNPLKAGQRKGDLDALNNDKLATTETTARYDFSYPCPPTCPTSTNG